MAFSKQMREKILTDFNNMSNKVRFHFREYVDPGTIVKLLVPDELQKQALEIKSLFQLPNVYSDVKIQLLHPSTAETFTLEVDSTSDNTVAMPKVLRKDIDPEFVERMAALYDQTKKVVVMHSLGSAALGELLRCTSTPAQAYFYFTRLGYILRRLGEGKMADKLEGAGRVPTSLPPINVEVRKALDNCDKMIGLFETLGPTPDRPSPQHFMLATHGTVSFQSMNQLRTMNATF